MKRFQLNTKKYLKKTEKINTRLGNAKRKFKNKNLII